MQVFRAAKGAKFVPRLGSKVDVELNELRLAPATRSGQGIRLFVRITGLDSW